MILTANTSDERAQRVVALLHDLIRDLPPQAATIESRRTERNDGAVVCLKPSNPRAAEFSVHLEDDHPVLIDVSFGSGTTLELPWEAKLPSDASFEMVLEVVRELASAVVAGRCEERFGFLGIRGAIHVDANNTYRCTHFFHPHLRPTTVRYKAYADLSEQGAPNEV